MIRSFVRGSALAFRMLAAGCVILGTPVLADTPSVTNLVPAPGSFTNTNGIVFRWQFSSLAHAPQKTFRLLIGSPGFGWTNHDSGVVTSSATETTNTSVLADGIYEWKVMVTDQNDDQAETLPSSFGKDMTWPDQPEYVTPDGIFLSSSNQLLDINFRDNVQLSSVKYRIDGSGNEYVVATNINAISFTNDFSLAAAWNSCSRGLHTIDFIITDRAGGITYSATHFQFYKDDLPPGEPDFNTAECQWFQSSPTLDIDFWDIVALNRIEYRVDAGGGWLTLAENLPGVSYTTNWQLPPGVWTGLADGLHFIYFRVTDDAGLQYLTPDFPDAFALRKGSPPSTDFTCITNADNTATLTGYAGSGGPVIIPSSLGGLPVTCIGSFAFYCCTNLTGVTIPAAVTNIGEGAFYGCTALTEAYFKGEAPSLGAQAFSSDSQATVYYCPNMAGWGAMFGGRPTAQIYLQILAGDSFGIRTNTFGFTFAGASNMVVVVDGSTDLIHWDPLQTNSLAGGMCGFGDPLWTNHPARFYRVRWP